MTEPLTKVDSAVEGVAPAEEKKAPVEKKKPRQSTIAAEGVFKIEDLGRFVSVYSVHIGTLR